MVLAEISPDTSTAVTAGGGGGGGVGSIVELFLLQEVAKIVAPKAKSNSDFFIIYISIVFKKCLFGY